MTTFGETHLMEDDGDEDEIVFVVDGSIVISNMVFFFVHIDDLVFFCVDCMIQTNERHRDDETHNTKYIERT